MCLLKIESSYISFESDVLKAFDSLGDWHEQGLMGILFLILVQFDITHFKRR